jgi:hypothetical protein
MREYMMGKDHRPLFVLCACVSSRLCGYVHMLRMEGDEEKDERSPSRSGRLVRF